MKFKHARKLYEKVVAFMEETFGADHVDTAYRYANLAHTLQQLGDLEGARSLLKKSIASYEKHLGKEHPLTCSIYEQLATVLWEMKDVSGAIKMIKTALGDSEGAELFYKKAYTGILAEPLRRILIMPEMNVDENLAA